MGRHVLVVGAHGVYEMLNPYPWDLQSSWHIGLEIYVFVRLALNWIFKFMAGIIECLMQEHRLKVAKALGHLELMLRRERCPLGSCQWCAQLLALDRGGLYGPRPRVVVGGTGGLIHEQQPGESPSPLGVGTSERGSGEVPPRIRAHVDPSKGEALWLEARPCPPSEGRCEER